MIKHLLFGTLSALLVLGCSPQSLNPLKPSIEPNIKLETGMAEAHQITIKAFDDRPIAGAQVLIGDSLNSPFYGNFMTTDSSGHILVPAEWNQALPITVEAPGFVRTSYMDQVPNNITIYLHPSKATSTHYEVKGASQDLPVKNGDDQFDFGIVISAFSKMDLLAFNLDTIISPNTDRISAVGQEVNIPSNISLPRQNERYSFLTITLDKPTYRTYFPQKGINRIVSLKARFPFRDVVDSLRAGKSFLELINLFKIGGAGIRDIDVQSNSTLLNIPSSEISFSDQKNVLAPIFRSDETFLAVGITNQSGYMFPTDIKNISSGKNQPLNLVQNADQRLLGVLTKTDDLKQGQDRMSVALIPFKSVTTPKLLPIVGKPSLVGPNEAILPILSSVDGINALATYSVLSEQVEVNQGPDKTKIMVPKWEIYSSNWIAKLTLPTWPQETRLYANDKNTKRLDINFIGSQTTSQVELGPAMIESATHVTRSSITY